MLTEQQLIKDAETCDRDRFLIRARLMLARLADEERLTLINDLLEGYCRNCGTPDPRCPCANDE
jgi:hypothetical protein